MKFRKRFFGGLALLVAAIMVIMIISTATAEPDPDPGVENQDAYEAGWAIGSGIAATAVLCVGLPVFLGLALLSWRNAVGLRNERRHQEQMRAIRNKEVA